MQVKCLVHSAGKIEYFAFLYTFFKVYVALSIQRCRAEGASTPQKFWFVENSGTEVSTRLFTVELSDIFLRKKIFCSSTCVRIAEHEKSSCHFQASVQWFEAEQRLTKGCSLDSSHYIYHLPRHQTVIAFGCLRVLIGKRNTTSKSRYINVEDTPSSYTTEWKFQCVLKRGKAKIVNVIQHIRSCSSHWAAVVLFDQSTMRIIQCVWYVFSTFCDVIVVKYF